MIRSFFELLQRVDTSDYYAFCDQDDYWMEDKMTRAVEILDAMRKDVPVLYCCRSKLVDQNLQPLESEIKRPPMRPGFRNAMIENIVTGCTAVFDQSLREMVVKELPQFTVMHDWWLYLIATCFGEIYYDETPYICYRQHHPKLAARVQARPSTSSPRRSSRSAFRVRAGRTTMHLRSASKIGRAHV